MNSDVKKEELKQNEDVFTENVKQSELDVENSSEKQKTFFEEIFSDESWVDIGIILFFLFGNQLIWYFYTSKFQSESTKDSLNIEAEREQAKKQFKEIRDALKRDRERRLPSISEISIFDYKITFFDYSFIFVKDFFKIFFFIIFILFIFICVTRILSFKSFNSKGKVSSYECGFISFSKVTSKFNVQFFFVALLFIIFDLEISFIYPVMSLFYYLTYIEFCYFFFFLLFLFIGFFLEWYFGFLMW